MDPGTADAPRPSLRIAVITYYLPSTSKMGVGYQAHELATELVRRGHTVEVFSECPPVPGAVYDHRHIQIPGSLRTFRFALALRHINWSGYDVLHAHGDDYWLWRKRVPRHIRTLHGSCFEEARTVKGFKEKARMLLLGMSELLATAVADTTVVVSPATRKWTPWVHEVIPNGVDTLRFHPDAEARAADPTVLFVGTWHGRKRGEVLAAAFAEVRRVLPSAELRMVTQDAPPQPGPGVTILGRLDDDALAQEYRNAWVFCLPSTYEGFGIPYAEAMASGTAVVATPNIGARYVSDQGRDAKLVDLEDLGFALATLLSDETQRGQLAQRGLDRARVFSLTTVVDSYERLYRSS